MLSPRLASEPVLHEPPSVLSAGLHREHVPDVGAASTPRAAAQRAAGDGQLQQTSAGARPAGARFQCHLGSRSVGKLIQ